MDAVALQAMPLQHPCRAAGGNTGRRLRRERVGGPLVLRRQVEDKKSNIQEAEIKELRVQVEQLRKHQRGEVGQEGQGDPARRESGFEEDWDMDCEEEVENKKNLDEQRKRLQKQLRDLDKFTCMPSKLKETWLLELQGIEQKRNDLEPEHRRVQKRSQKIQSIQDKKRNMLKDVEGQRGNRSRRGALSPAVEKKGR